MLCLYRLAYRLATRAFPEIVLILYSTSLTRSSRSALESDLKQTIRTMPKKKKQCQQSLSILTPICLAWPRELTPSSTLSMFLQACTCVHVYTCMHTHTHTHTHTFVFSSFFSSRVLSQIYLGKSNTEQKHECLLEVRASDPQNHQQTATGTWELPGK